MLGRPNGLMDISPLPRMSLEDSMTMEMKSPISMASTPMMERLGAPTPAMPSKPSNPAGPIDADQLRSLVQDCISKHMYPSATFFADKLVTVTSGDLDDVFLLAQCYFVSKQFRRAVHLLKSNDLLDGDGGMAKESQHQYLAALCLAECKEWEECLSVIGEDDDDQGHLLSSARNLSHSLGEEDGSETAAIGAKINLGAAICLLRGKVYEALENRQRAIQWYQRALTRDVNCYEALERLVEKRMLKHAEQRALLASLSFPPHLEWLRFVYQTKLQQHEQTQLQQHEPDPPDQPDPVQDQGREFETRLTTFENDYGLVGNLELMSGLAEHHYYRNDYRKCYQLSKTIIDQDPYHHAVLPVYLCSLVELEMKSELFYCAHQLVEAYPKTAVAWFSVACYYYLIGKFDFARRYFNKATGLDHHFAPGWIGFGHAFAAQEESDQAMAAYRTAARLFEGSHMPLLCIGMEYLRTNNLNLAQQFLNQTFTVCGTDPLIYNELGVICYKREDYAGAVDHFQKALELSSKEALDSWEPTLFNLGHSLRKLRKFDEAIRYYQLALSVTPKAASISSALGFTYHLQGKLDTAVQYYHKALGIQPRDIFTYDMLTKALQEIFTS